MVWFVAKHKSVSRYAELIDDAKNRTARQQLPQSFVSELESGGSEHQTPVRKEILLDPIGNVPLKMYDVSFDSIDDLVDQSWTPQMHLTEEERKVVEKKGTVLLLGRSGTGKTVCISNRIEYDRQRFAGRDDFTQLFLSRSSRLCRYVEGAVGKTDGSTFTTFDKHVRHLESLLKEEINGVYHPEKHVTFARFRQRFYAERYPQEEISALIVWRAIKTFLKGSIEAFKCPDGILPKEAFVAVETLGKNRCTIPVELRGPIYDIFLRYRQWIWEENLWDDCDHIVALLKAIDDAKKNPDSLVYEEEIKKSKLYVDVSLDSVLALPVSFITSHLPSTLSRRCKITLRLRSFYSFSSGKDRARCFSPAILRRALWRAQTSDLKRSGALATMWQAKDATSSPRSL